MYGLYKERLIMVSFLLGLIFGIILIQYTSHFIIGAVLFTLFGLLLVIGLYYYLQTEDAYLISIPKCSACNITGAVHIWHYTHWEEFKRKYLCYICYQIKEFEHMIKSNKQQAQTLLNQEQQKLRLKRLQSGQEEI